VTLTVLVRPIAQTDASSSWDVLPLLAQPQQGGGLRIKAARRRAAKDALRQGRAVPIDTHQVLIDRLAAAQSKLAQLHAEGRISDAEMPTILRPVR
jgi:hypothetical protein